MKKVVKFLILLTISINVVYSGTIPSDGNSEFAVDLFTKISATKKNENVLVSPFSVRTSLALVYAGSSGETAEEFTKGLHLQMNDKSLVNEQFKTALSHIDENSLIHVANKIYVKSGYTLKPDYKNVVENVYKSEIELADFSDKKATVNNVNKWVENKTNGKIQNILDESAIDDDLRSILLNAIHFKANWLLPFQNYSTTERDFWTTSTTSVKVDMMHQQDVFAYAELPSLEAQAVQLPYDNSDLSLLIILPNSRDGLENLEKKLNTVNLLNLGLVYSRRQDVILDIPKFRTEFSLELSDILKQSGIVKAFTDSAEIYDVIENTPMKVSKIIHKTFIGVDEQGTEAGAATALLQIDVLSAVLRRLEPVNFRADHPFVYVLKSPTQIYFIGKLVNPE